MCLWANKRRLNYIQSIFGVLNYMLITSSKQFHWVRSKLIEVPIGPFFFLKCWLTRWLWTLTSMITFACSNISLYTSVKQGEFYLGLSHNYPPPNDLSFKSKPARIFSGFTEDVNHQNFHSKHSQCRIYSYRASNKTNSNIRNMRQGG